ncbi:MAG: cob(I)yrinic acid a,c-diamide adenosyltransferase [Eubacterium sp.]|nr:cob(I)yrinic acid a,c-diamide adenosyltransferase [Eubacterium sp.]
MADNNLGCIHIYYGNGKGKTTCAMGLAVRAAGCGKKVLIVQFMKTGRSSEISMLGTLPGVEIMDAPRMTKFSFRMTDEEKQAMLAADNAVLSDISNKVSSADYDLLIMDECIGSCHKGFLDEQLLIDFLKNKPEHLEVVMTGRHPDDTLIGLADYVTEMHKVKHPYDEGIRARRGIEF